MAKWQFELVYTEESEQWRWAWWKYDQGSLHRYSRRDFQTLAECFADARVHGFQANAPSHDLFALNAASRPS